MEVFVEHLGAMQFDIKARQHSVVCDQPADNGGFDEGMTPPEFLLAALGSCAAFYATQYLRKQGLAKEGTSVRTTAEKLLGPPRLDNFRIEILSPVFLSPEHEAGVTEAVKRCLIHNTLLHPPKIELNIRNGSPAGHMPVAA
jgi:putative redox protein